MRCEWMAAAVVSVACAAALGQVQPEKPAEAPKSNSNPPAPEAPKTDAAQNKPGPTLVKRDAAGNLQRLDIAVEEAAIGVMDLTDAEKERVSKVVAERGATLDEIVLKNLDALTRLHNAIKSGDDKEARLTYVTFAERAERLNDRGKLEDEIKPQLRLDHVEQFTKLVNEYRQALLTDLAREAKAKSKDGKVDPQRLANVEIARAFGYQVRKSYDRTVGTPVTGFDSAVSKLALRPEQETKVRAIAADFAQKYAGKATPEQKRDAIMQMIVHMEAKERVEFIKLLREGA